MKKQVIHLYGASGSGTSTIGRAVGAQLGYFFMDTDDYFWQVTDPPYQRARETAERIALMRREIETHDRAVISGSLAGWGDPLIPYFTLAVRVATDTALRIERLRQRERRRFGSRIDPGGDLYEHHLEFIRWAASYDDGDADHRSKLRHDQWQKQLRCRILTVDGGLPVEQNVERIRRALADSAEQAAR